MLKRLFNRFDRYLGEKGLFVEFGHIVDASIVEVPKQRNSTEKMSSKQIYDLLAVCNDLYSKYDKFSITGQISHIALPEQAQFSAVQEDTNKDQLNKEHLKAYFLLFAEALLHNSLVVASRAFCGEAIQVIP